MALHHRPRQQGFETAWIAGRFSIWDIFQSKAVGSLSLTVAFQPAQEEERREDEQREHGEGVPATDALPDEGQQAVLDRLSELALHEGTAIPGTGATSRLHLFAMSQPFVISYHLNT